MLDTMVHPYIIGSLWYGNRWPGSRMSGSEEGEEQQEAPQDRGVLPDGQPRGRCRNLGRHLRKGRRVGPSWNPISSSTTYSGRPFTCWAVRPTYSPTRPPVRNWAPPKNRTQDGQGRVPGHVWREQVAVEDDQDADEADRAQHEPDDREPPKRGVGERQQAVQGQLDKLGHRVLRDPGPPPIALVRNAGLSETDPGPQATHEPIGLGQAVQVVHDPAAHRAEVAGVERDVDIGEPVEQPVEDEVGQPLRDPVLAAAADAVRDVPSFFQLCEELGQKLRRVLEIAVEHRDDIAVGVAQPRGDGGLVPEVARERHDANGLVLELQGLQDPEGAVSATVIDEDDLGRTVKPRHSGPQPLAQLSDHILLVVQRDDDRVACGSHRRAVSRPARV